MDPVWLQVEAALLTLAALLPLALVGLSVRAYLRTRSNRFLWLGFAFFCLSLVVLLELLDLVRNGPSASNLTTALLVGAASSAFFLGSTK